MEAGSPCSRMGITAASHGSDNGEMGILLASQTPKRFFSSLDCCANLVGLLPLRGQTYWQEGFYHLYLRPSCSFDEVFLIIQFVHVRCAPIVVEISSRSGAPFSLFCLA